MTIIPLAFMLGGCGEKITVLHPQGPVSRSEFHLMVWSFIIMVLVVLTVIAIFTYVVIRYRERPDNMDYDPPETQKHRGWEITWTTVPVILVILLAVPNVKTIYKLDQEPKHPSGNTPLIIYVTSADWKWIFKYPNQKIETVNYVNIPAETPIRFELTSASAMNSFWVPALGGQEFDMPGKSLKLWLQADKPGTYEGRSANFSGKGFAHMSFQVKSLKTNDFSKWVQHVKATAPKLSESTYQKLLKQGTTSEHTFSSIDHEDFGNDTDMKRMND
jgi:cytochrome aa3-600 menaquinol oxidase subunit 2